MLFGLKKHFRPRSLAFLVLIGILLVLPIPSGLAQESSLDSKVYLPLFDTLVPAQTAGQVEQVGEGEADSHGNHEHTGIGHIPENGRFTTNTGQTNSWPPQVKYIKNIVWDSPAARVRSSQVDVAQSVEEIAAQDPQVIEWLGERYTYINTAPIREKWQPGNLGHEITYFSYSNNITIEVTIKDAAVEAVETYAADVYQPPLRQNEVDEAIAIAREYWLAQGNSRVNDLQGFTIQTFVTEGDGGYYDSRMTYVSFHVDEISIPELLTWVDLTSQSVVRAAVDVDGVQNEQ